MQRRPKGMSIGSVSGAWGTCGLPLQEIKLPLDMLQDSQHLRNYMKGLIPYKCYKCTIISWHPVAKDRHHYLCNGQVWK
jgi:hypothetical protein